MAAGKQKMAISNDKLIVRNAVGRLARLGDLYDARTDCFVGFSVLNESIPENFVAVIKTPASSFNYINTENIWEKFEKLNIVPELRASIIANLVSLEGHAKYLQTEQKNKKARKSIIYSIQTEVEKMIFTDQLKRHFVLQSLDLDFATHFVARITYGANSVITLEENDYSSGEKRLKVNEDLNHEIQKIKTRICEVRDPILAECETPYSIKIFSDILPTNNSPKTAEEKLKNLKMLTELPKMVKMVNRGKGKPITFGLMPISALDDYLNGTNTKEAVSHLDKISILYCTTSISELTETKLEINDLMYKLETHQYCVPVESLRKLGQVISQVEKEELKSRTKFKEAIIAVRSGDQSVEMPKTCEFSSEDFKIQLKEFDNLLGKIELADKLKSLGVYYIGSDQSQGLDEIKALSQEVYILSLQSECQQTNTQSRNENQSHFFNLIDQSRANNIETSFVAIDHDVRIDLKIDENDANTRIALIRNQQVVDHDVYATHLRQKFTCYARISGSHEDRLKPQKRTELELKCPGSFSGTCSKDTRKWYCYKCKEVLYFGFDAFFYCSCGGASFEKYSFRCTDDQHGPDFIPYCKNQLKKLLSKIPSLNELNVLILGVTGVGKSTWINAFLNYLTFPSLDAASKGELLSVTSTSFQITDESDTPHTIRFGHDDNEVLEPGQSATQDVKAHVFSTGDTLLRLIDTPGIGDVRGVKQDKENFKKILKYLRSLKWLNGICILLKPNESRLNMLFEFCVKELLTHLHCSAGKNVVFCFTHSRETFYKPGDTRQPLGELLSKNNVELTLEKDTMYCMDNESFRFLCAAHQGVEFRDSVKKSFRESWNISVEETKRLITHFKKVKPHVIEDTISLNDARQNIVCLTKPIADISKNIQQNLAIIKDKRDLFLSTEANEKDLMKMLSVDIITLKTEPLEHPRTVCGASSCIKYHPAADGNVSAVQYVQHCHNPCHLVGVPVNIVGDARIKGCAVMSDTTSNCIRCGCSWDQHLHITYVQIPVVNKITVPDVERKIGEKKSELQEMYKFVSELDGIIAEQEAEQKKIIEVSVMMGHYLSRNTIFGYDDVLGRYFDHLIENEEQKVAVDGNRSVLKRLKLMRAMYDEEVKSLKSAIKAGKAKDLTYAEFQTHLVGLYTLKHNGAQLRQAIEMASLKGSEEVKKDYEKVHEVKTADVGQLESKQVVEPNTESGEAVKTVRSVLDVKSADVGQLELKQVVEPNTKESGEAVKTVRSVLDVKSAGVGQLELKQVVEPNTKESGEAVKTVRSVLDVKSAGVGQLELKQVVKPKTTKDSFLMKPFRWVKTMFWEKKAEQAEDQMTT